MITEQVVKPFLPLGSKTVIECVIEKCGGDYVVILHDDCEVTEGWEDIVWDRI